MRIVARFVVGILLIPVLGLSQQKDTLVKQLDSLSIKTDTSGNGKTNDIDRSIYENAKLDFGDYFRLLGDDLKQDLTLPFHAKKKDVVRLGEFALVTGGVALADKPINRFTVNLHNNNRGVASASKYVTKFGGDYEVYALAGFFTYGLVFNTEKEKTTTALATQAYITAAAVATIAKYVAGEQRPYYTDPNTGRRGPIFHGPFYPFSKTSDGKRLSNSDYSAFPSGHTTVAFAAATVYAMEYRDKPLIPILSYSAATLIGISRMTENQHWASDVVAGALLGYLCGRQVVNNYHRYSKIKQGKVRKQLSFNLQYLNKQMIPGLVYKF
jgi:membrane-associated phospholipid phosphatase